MRYVLFYQPPCGAWYVHSHKLYESVAKAKEAAEKFLPAGTHISVVPCSADVINHYRERV